MVGLGKNANRVEGGERSAKPRSACGPSRPEGPRTRGGEGGSEEARSNLGLSETRKTDTADDGAPRDAAGGRFVSRWKDRARAGP